MSHDLVHIYMPRLDVTFKKGPVPEARGNITPIRFHWLQFVRNLFDTYIESGIETCVYEMPLWEMTPTFVYENSKDATRIYIPHKQNDTWQPDPRVRYYMQMVIPSIFSIDPDGWCAGASVWPINANGDANSGIFDQLAERINSNVSKFDQPERGKNKLGIKDYVFFPCQIPHDETIKYHSDFTVEDALNLTLNWVERTDKKLVIKGHPVNPGSMANLKMIASRRSCIWVDDGNIHDLLADARLVVTVNSGVGFEAILHDKPVFTFGRADYDAVSYGGVNQNDKGSISTKLEQAWTGGLLGYPTRSLYRRFVDAWYNTHYDVNNIATFEKAVEQ
jgi:hypothetical protein